MRGALLISPLSTGSPVENQDRFGESCVFVYASASFDGVADFLATCYPHARRQLQELAMVTEKSFDRARGALPRLVRARSQLTRKRASFLALLDASTVELTRIAPPGGGWSALEILEHLARTEFGIALLLQTSSAGRPALPVPARRSAVPTWLPTRWKLVLLAHGLGRATSPRAVQPQPGRSDDEVRALARKAREELFHLLDRPDAARLAAQRYPHPFLGDLDGIEWVEFLAAHEERHLRQARSTLASLG
jgi:hypothetical protein